MVVCLLVSLECLLINAWAVANAPTLTFDSLGPLALAYHDKQPRPAAVAVIIVILLIGTWLSRVGRVAVIVFVGAAAANFASPLIWGQGIPDYIVVRRLDLIANISDILMIGAGTVIVASLFAQYVRRLATSS